MRQNISRVRRLICSASRYIFPSNGLYERMMSAMVAWPCTSARGAGVRSARSRSCGFVSLTMRSQKSTNTRLSWKMAWSNMYSAASPRFTISSASGGILMPYAMFCA
jgi:hypothetical protein